MAVITLTIPDAVLPRVIDALCLEGQREEDSPIAKPAFAKSVVVAWVRDVVIKHETRSAMETARLTADGRARSEVTIT